MRNYTAAVWSEGDWYVAQCRQVDVASQGRTEAEAVDNLREALGLFLEEPGPDPLPGAELAVESSFYPPSNERYVEITFCT